MSKYMNARANRTNIRWQLLSTVSAAALLGAVYGTQRADAAQSDADRPTVWIELGGLADAAGGGQEPFAPPFIASVVQAGFTSPVKIERPPLYSKSAEASISFEPEGTDWVFSAAIRFGRSNGSKSIRQQTPGDPVIVHLGNQSGPLTPQFVNFSDTRIKHKEAHTVLDFSAGKDVGLGMFGSSSVSAGVRYAQLSAREQGNVSAFTGFYIPTNIKYFRREHYHLFLDSSRREQSFQGLGPSLSWKGSTPFMGNKQDGEVAIDWGVNAAVLFGRQKTSGQHQTSGQYWKAKYGLGHPVYQHAGSFDRSKTVIVPNLGGFAALSYNFENAKLSLGYRGDFFFGAMDGGIDTRQTHNREFYGPFASISVGLGD